METGLLCTQSAIKGAGELVSEALQSLGTLFTTNPLDMVKALVESIKDLVSDAAAGRFDKVAEAIAPELSNLIKTWNGSETGEQCRLVARPIPEVIGFILLGAKAAQVATLVQQQGLKGALKSMIKAGADRVKDTGERLLRSPAEIRRGVERLREEVKNFTRRSDGRGGSDAGKIAQRVQDADLTDLEGIHVNVQPGGAPGAPDPGPTAVVGRSRKSRLPKLRFDEYLNEVEKLASNRPLGEKQRSRLEHHRHRSEHAYLGKEATAARRAEFSKKKPELIQEWERQTGERWPTYRKDIPSADPNAPPFRMAGSYYDAHEIIPNSYGGPQEWWNIHPAKAPVQHQSGIHGAGRLFRELFPLD